METKICNGILCKGTEKALSEFYNDNSKKDGKCTYCKECSHEAKKTPKIRQRRNDWCKLDRLKHPEYYMLEDAKKRATEKGVPFELTEADISIPDLCPYIGIPLRQSKSGNPSPNSPSLDRIIPELGYVKGNIIVISHLANTMKNTGTLVTMYKMFAGAYSTFTSHPSGSQQVAEVNKLLADFTQCVRLDQGIVES